MQGANEVKTGRARQLRRTQTDAERKLWCRLNNRQLDGQKFVRQNRSDPTSPTSPVASRCRRLDLSPHAGRGEGAP